LLREDVEIRQQRLEIQILKAKLWDMEERIKEMERAMQE
jgi:hypothetical protein